MKTTFLVMTDPAKGAKEDNWTIMDYRQFCAFLKTEEGKKRRDCFERIGEACDEAGTIYIECSREKLPELWNERNHADYLLRQKEESGYRTMSLDATFEMTEEGVLGTLHDLVADERECTEDKALLAVFRKELPAALAELDEAELELILAFANDGSMSVARYARETGDSRRHIDNRKASALRKLRLHFRRKRLL